MMTTAENKIANKAEELCKEAIAEGFTAEEALSLISMGAVAHVCYVRVRHYLDNRKPTT